MSAISLQAEWRKTIVWTCFRRIVPPLVVFIIARMRLWRSAIFAGADPSDPHAWARWDSGHYLSIASHGYEFISCAKVPGYDPTQHCGNTAWLPGYPLLMRALMAFRLDPDTAGTLVSATFALGTLLILWNLFLDAEFSPPALLTLLLAAFFPGHVYYHGIFPVALHLNLTRVRGLVWRPETPVVFSKFLRAPSGCAGSWKRHS